MKIILLIMIGLSLLHAEFLRDTTKEVVQDTTTNLMWQDDATPATMTWSDAINYCEALTLATFTDWRLPNQNELKSIVDTSVVSPAMSLVFQNRVSSDYWSSTTYAGVTTDAWAVYFNYGYGTLNGKTDTYYVRCVR